MNLDVTVRAVRVLCVQIVLRTRRFDRTYVMRSAVTGETELGHAAGSQQSRIGRAMRRVTRTAAFSLKRRMFVNKRSLLISMTLNAGGIGAGR